MVEEKLSIEELSRRIDQLLDILNMISRDLAEISKSIKAVDPAIAQNKTLSGQMKAFVEKLEEVWKETKKRVREREKENVEDNTELLPNI